MAINLGSNRNILFIPLYWYWPRKAHQGVHVDAECILNEDPNYNLSRVKIFAFLKTDFQVTS